MAINQKEEDVLEVLLYLFENYMVEGAQMRPDQDILNAELVNAGFGEGEIGKAFDWLDDLTMLCNEDDTEKPENLLTGGSSSGVRHLSRAEFDRLGKEGWGLITLLETAAVLDPDTRELVIDRIMALDSVDVDVDHVRWVIMMVLCSRQPQDDQMSMWVEELVMDGAEPH